MVKDKGNPANDKDKGGGHDDPVTVDRHGVTTKGKHLMLAVPDFGTSDFPVQGSGGSSFTTRAMTSYLRMGAVPGHAYPEPGDELLDYLAAAGPPGDPALGDTNLPNAKTSPDAKRSKDDADKAGNREVYFVDDVRHRDPDNPGHGMTKEQRQQESSKLKTRGGWRDHSDGNRISTTYGDKVEIVRGNYKMVVMGRQNDTGEAMGWDAAGSHIHDFAPGTMPGASVYQEYIQDYAVPNLKEKKDEDGKGTGKYEPEKDGEGNTVYASNGVWLLVNSTENVWEYARNAGNFREEHWGDLHETYVGSENPPDSGSIAYDKETGMQGHPSDGDEYGVGTKGRGARPKWADTSNGIVRSNPHIIEKVWARKIESYAGSSAWRIPEIKEEKWAVETDELTDLSGGSNSITRIGRGIAESLSVGAGIASNTNVGAGVVNNTNIGGALVENTNVGLTKIDMTHALTVFEETICGLHVEFHGSVNHTSIEVGTLIDIFLGAKLEIDISRAHEITLGKHTEYKSKKDKAAIKDLKLALSSENTQMRMSSTSQKEMIQAMNATINALVVQLGV